MKHRVRANKLSRNSARRKALFKNLINGLILHGEIKTTASKAKAIRGLTDKLITKGKAGNLHARRLIAAFLQNKKVVNKIVDELGPIFKNRSSGFTRVTRLGKRKGDDALMVKLELVEKPVVKKVEEKEEEKKEKVGKKKIGKISLKKKEPESKTE